MTEANEVLKKLTNPTLAFYLELMEETETPPLFHAWSLISAASACMTRRAYLDMGPIRVMPNQYIMLVGPPGVRKSQGISFIRKLLDGIDGMRFAPNSTAGRMQGLIAAMQGPQRKSEEDEALESALGSLTNLNLGFDGAMPEDTETTHVLNRHAMYVAEGELVSFLGMKAHEFIDFLGDMWDKSGADEYQYQLKREKVKIGLPCLNMIGAITPMHITTYLPPQAVGQGFTSRVIMVYEDRGKKVPWPDPISEEGFKQVQKLMRWIFDAVEGPFSYTPEARAAVIRLYEYDTGIGDVRFLHYKERRQTHIIKIAMALCVLRRDTTLSEYDILDAHALLSVTEARMAECLGEYGLSPLALAKARVQDVLKASRQPLTANRIVASCGSDVARADVVRALFEMSETGTIIDVQLRDPTGIITTGYVWPMVENPFERNQRIAVDYLVSDKAVAVPKRAEQSDKYERAAHLLDGAPATRQSFPDVSDIPEVEAIAEASELAAQGFSSVADKLRSFISNRKENPDE